MDVLERGLQPARHHHPGLAGERDRRGRHQRRLDQRRAAPARRRPRGRRRARHRRLRPHLRATPLLCDLKPGGKYVAVDLYDAGGVPLVAKRLLEAGLLHEDAITVTGRTIGEHARDADETDGPAGRAPARRPDQGDRRPGHPARQPRARGLRRQARRPRAPPHTGPARVFECEEDAMAAVTAGTIEQGDVVVIRNEGPAGGPGMREMLAVTAAIVGAGPGRARRAAHRRPLLRRHPRLHGRPRRARGGRAAARSPPCATATRSPSTSTTAASTSTSTTRRSPRASRPTTAPPADLGGVLAKYAKLVSSASSARSPAEPRTPSKLRSTPSLRRSANASRGRRRLPVVG